MMHLFRLLVVAMLVVPAALNAQARFISDPMPGLKDDRGIGGAQVKQLPAASPRRPVASQFDREGTAPLGIPGDIVTIFYFPDGANLGRARQARITSRRRFLPPNSWRAACDNVAHPGWFYGLDAPPTSNFAVVVPGAHAMPVRRDPPPLARAGASRVFRRWADSVWHRYESTIKPGTERSRASLYLSFFGDKDDAGWGRTKMIGIRGPDGHNYGVFSIWMRDDQRDGSPNTTTTWVVNAWGYPVARAEGNLDIYGTSDSDGDGVDEVITSGGLIRWDGQKWGFPRVYVEEPCLLRRVTSPPPGWSP